MEYLFQRLLRALVWIGILAVPLTIFIVDSQQLFPFITGKNFFFRVITEFIFCIWVALSILDSSYRPRGSWIMYTLAFFVATIFVSNILGVNPYSSFWSNFERMDGWITLIHLFMYFIVLSSFIRSGWNIFWVANIFASVVVGVMTIIELLGNNGERVVTTFGNASYQASYSLLMLFVTIWYAHKTKGWWLRLLYLPAILLQILSIYFTQTRGAILGVVIGLFVLLLLKSVANKKVRAITLLTVVFVTTSSVVLWHYQDADLISKHKTLHRLATTSIHSNTVASRLYLWGMSIDGFKERPLLGWGQGNFTYVFDKYYDDRLYGQEPWFDHAHSVYFDWLVSGGIIGLLAYLSLFAVFIRAVLWNSKITLGEKVSLIALVSAYTVQNLFIFDQITSYIIFVGLLANIHSIESDGVSFNTTRKKGVKRLVAVAMVITAILLPVWVNKKPYQQSRSSIRAMSSNNVSVIYDELNRSLGYRSFGTNEVRERLLEISAKIFISPNVEDGVKLSFANLAYSELSEMVEDNPGVSRYRLLLSSFLLQVGNFEESKYHLREAIKISPQKKDFYDFYKKIEGLSV